MTMDLFAQPGDRPTDEKFDPFKDDLVVDFQPPTAVFINNAGGVTIMQDHTGWMGASEVMVVLTTRQAVQAVIGALNAKLGEI